MGIWKRIKLWRRHRQFKKMRQESQDLVAMCAGPNSQEAHWAESDYKPCFKKAIKKKGSLVLKTIASDGWKYYDYQYEHGLMIWTCPDCKTAWPGSPICPACDKDVLKGR